MPAVTVAGASTASAVAIGASATVIAATSSTPASESRLDRGSNPICVTGLARRAGCALFAVGFVAGFAKLLLEVFGVAGAGLLLLQFAFGFIFRIVFAASSALAWYSSSSSSRSSSSRSSSSISGRGARDVVDGHFAQHGAEIRCAFQGFFLEVVHLLDGGSMQGEGVVVVFENLLDELSGAGSKAAGCGHGKLRFRFGEATAPS